MSDVGDSNTMGQMPSEGDIPLSEIRIVQFLDSSGVNKVAFEVKGQPSLTDGLGMLDYARWMIMAGNTGVLRR